MRRSVVAVSTVCILAGSPAWAQETPSAQLDAVRRMVQEVLKQNEDLRKRVRELEEAVAKQGQATKEAAKEAAKEVAQEAPKDPATAPAAEPTSAVKPPWAKLQLGGALEVEAFSSRGFSGKRRSEFQLTTAEIDFEADVVNWAKAELSFQWDRDSDTVKLNEAFITLGRPTIPVYLKAGQGVAPFGISSGATVAARISDTLTLTGPLTTDIFEAKEDHVLLGFRKWGFHAGSYVYNGTTNDVPGGGKQLNHYGFTAGYEIKTDTVSFDVSAYWINSVFDTDGLTSAFPELQVPGRNYVPGVALVARLGLWGFSLIGEYNAAIRHARILRTSEDTENIYNVKPEAWQVELGYTTDFFFDIKTYVAVNYSQSASMLGAFPKNRLLATAGAWLFHDNIRLAAEYSAEKDYSRVQLGTNAHGETWTLRLTYEW